MDNYPKHLAPNFEDCGAVATGGRECSRFPHAPENVAREWIHRH